MKYDVHVFAIVRVTVPGIEADSQEEAIKKAKELDLNFLGTPYLPKNVEAVEYADDLDGFFVDEENDPEHERSCFYDKHGVPV